MKNMTFYIFLITFLFSCHSTKTLEDPVEERVVTGFIESLELSSFQYGTHLLVNEEGVALFALTSEVVDLEEFVDLEVELGGTKILGYPVDAGPIYLDVKWVKKKEN